MAPKFGTSGLRGLVIDLNPALVSDHVRAFLHACPVGTGVWVGHDLRDSSPQLAQVVADAARGEGVAVTDCGAVATPALALAAMTAGAGAVMVTGSHIPADRNGLKFYTPDGEITKADEGAILSALGRKPKGSEAPLRQLDPGPEYAARYIDAFGTDALTGLRIGVYTHSTVIRDLMLDTLAALGGQVVELGRAESFVPVDTEAVDPATQARIRAWSAQGLDAIVSADGDGDRPLLSDATGAIVPGDILGAITAEALGAETVVTPVSSNTGVEAGGRFSRVIRTRIGSPHVIAGMARAGGRVVGYEANGGFLLGFAASGPAGPLPPLMTRDSLLPIVATLARARGRGVAALVAAQPARFTRADRLEQIDPARAATFLATLAADGRARHAFLAPLGVEAALDQTDGLRMTLGDGRIVHLRPSGNAPEFRVYVEAGSAPDAQALLAQALAAVRASLG